MSKNSLANMSFYELRRARIQLRSAFLLFAIITLIPLYLLVNHAYQVLENDQLLKDQLKSDEIAYLVSSRIEAFLTSEKMRPSSHYEFFTLASNQLMSVNAIGFSPLSELNLQKDTNQGIIGYFQIAPDGKRSTPLLPNADVTTIANQTKKFEENEFDSRLEIWNRIEAIINQDSSFIDYMRVRELDDKGLFLFRSPLTNHFILTRQIFQGRNAYIQGLIIEPKSFLEGIVRKALNNFISPSKHRVTILLENQLIGGVLNEMQVLSEKRASEWLEQAKNERHIKTVMLPSPFEKVELRFSKEIISIVSDHTAVNQLVYALLSVLVLGSLLIYKISVAHLKIVEERTNFVSAVTHELKTPLTSIRMYGEMLKEGWIQDDSKRKSYYEFICQESERLSRLISNVLDVVKLSNNKEPVELSSIKTDALLDKSQQLIKGILEKENFELELAPLSGGLSEEILVLINQDAFSQILINLVDNSIKFSKESEVKKISIGFRIFENNGNDELQLYFRDYGPGIPLKYSKKVFDLFFRGQNELTRTSPGAGIGLTLVKELVQKMGAQVELTDCQPGCEFRIIFKENNDPKTFNT